ncbi:MAG TPA: zf-HC2 domain-containing protein [Dictyoglomaceae bacterium]|nr:zf-HC2 domain-containing protein [Dictyoglomaceae bacterium]HOL39452.1 zf-HC2 domain-containing protein [Dictyoglomaceae bacterium]HOP94750.1 zf-HC2 domain-containing protein [Dictyoglomaceae bacterium]HPP15407.1 zf-HC2 domain-containing protein [Dictyoglomaceae bacterium]HPU43846.1 zf-HC2 domain-containing protein [Dictyoglomaceae bacterium]
MKCKEAKRLMSSYIDGEISSLKKRELEEHLEKCISCKKELLIMEDLLKNLHRLPEISPSENFSEVVWAKYLLEEEKRTRNYKKLFLVLGFAVLFFNILFVGERIINEMFKPSQDVYSYYEIHIKTSSFIQDSSFVDFVLYNRTGNE